jgi:hypothetical protein
MNERITDTVTLDALAMALLGRSRRRRGRGGHGIIGHDAGAPSCMGSQHATVEDEIDPGGGVKAASFSRSSSGSKSR